MDLLAFLMRYAAATVDQIISWGFFASKSRAYSRLKLLEDAGYIDHYTPYRHAPGFYQATGPGAEVAGVGLSPLRLSVANVGKVRHVLEMVDLSMYLLRDNPGSDWTTEREITSRRLGQRRDLETGRLVAGDEGRRPDGILHLPSRESVAVELELTPKSTGQYEEILRNYTHYATRRDLGIEQVWWYFDSKAAHDRVHRLGTERFPGLYPKLFSTFYRT